MAVNNASKIFQFPNTVLKAGSEFSSYSPWDIIVTMTGGGNYDYILIPSTINGVVPDNYSLTGTGDTSSQKFIYLSVEATDGRITLVELHSAIVPTDAPDVLQSLPPSSFNVPIGVINTDGIYYKFVAGLPIIATPTVSFESDRTPPVPGLSPRIQWWTWVMTQ